jgi:hypothetical protein
MAAAKLRTNRDAKSDSNGMSVFYFRARDSFFEISTPSKSGTSLTLQGSEIEPAGRMKMSASPRGRIL